MNENNRINPSTILAFKQGDKAAFEEIYHHCSARLFNFIHSLSVDKNTTQDITQNVFIKLWERRTDIDPNQHLEAYIFTIARHLIYKELQERLQNSIFIKSLDEGMEQSDCSTEFALEAHFTQEAINALINQLPEMQKKVFKMSRFMCLSNKDIAHLLSISERTVETHLYRATCYLREHFSTIKEWSLLLLFFDSAF